VYLGSYSYCWDFPYSFLTKRKKRCPETSLESFRPLELTIWIADAFKIARLLIGTEVVFN
jgi:hypothetical protein